MVRYSLGAIEDQIPIDWPAFHAWQSPDGEPWLSFYRKGADYLLRFPGLADFDVTADGREVHCRPAPGVTGNTLEHLYTNQVLPLALSKQGRLVLHGSAVEADGSAIAFLGVSGRGKSTLGASFSLDGHRLVTDDRLEVAVQGREIQAFPSHPSIRLWDDSRKALALIGAGVPVAPPVEFTSKARFLAGGGLVFCAEPRPLRRLYFLGEGAVEEPVIRPVGAREALIELVGNAFLLDVEARDLISAHFEQLSGVARVPIHYRLDYPRRFDALGTVRRAILKHARRQSEAINSRFPKG